MASISNAAPLEKQLLRADGALDSNRCGQSTGFVGAVSRINKHPWLELSMQNTRYWQQILRMVVLIVAPFMWATASKAGDDAAAARRQSLRHSYGTYAGELRTADGRMDCDRLIAELGDLHANTYNWLISRANTDWEDLHTFLPLAKEKGIRVWVTLLPPSESAPKTKHNSEPFRLDYEKWAAELADLSVHEPALVAWSIDDFAYNFKTFTPDANAKRLSPPSARKTHASHSCRAFITVRRSPPLQNNMVNSSTGSYSPIAANQPRRDSRTPSL